VWAFNSPETILQTAKTSRTFRHIYKHPKSSNIFTAIQISVTIPATMTASEPLPTSIGLTLNGVDLVTLVTHLTGVSGINKHKLDTMLCRFVGQ